MASTAEDILATFPEFASADATIPLELAEAEQADLWGDVRYQQAIALRAAHMMARAGLGASGVSGAGNVASESIGSLSVSYDTSSGATGSDDLSTTAYGRMLMELLAGAIVGPMTSYE